jgi:lipopolysaccharide/colanic/teichoic acid biosynthesis glycosyltransferase
MSARVQVDSTQPGGFRLLFEDSEFQTAKVSSKQLQSSQDRIIRCIDVIIALAALVFFMPMLVLITTLVFLSDFGPVIFAHYRIGRDGRAFKCYKFRSMAVNSQALLEKLLFSDPAARAEWQRDHKLRNDPRITRFGNFLRKSSIDELPQLFNVLKGDMSIVGPRPIVRAEVVRYGRYFDHYCRVRPGLTGLWQVSGRNDTTYRRRVACDVTYVRSRSALGNLRIIFATVPSVLLRSGSY